MKIRTGLEGLSPTNKIIVGTAMVVLFIGVSAVMAIPLGWFITAHGYEMNFTARAGICGITFATFSFYADWASGRHEKRQEKYRR